MNEREIESLRNDQRKMQRTDNFSIEGKVRGSTASGCRAYKRAEAGKLAACSQPQRSFMPCK